MRDLRAALTELADRGTPIGSGRMRDRVAVELAGPIRRGGPEWMRFGWVVATAAAVVVLVVIGGTALLFGGAERSIPPPVGVEPSTTTAATTTVPPASAEGGTLTVVVSSLSGSLGFELAGVLMAWDYDPASPNAYRWDGVGGFAVTVDADPFATSQVLGEVAEEFPADPDSGRWPWASGEARIPAGEYTLWLSAGEDLCCYNRWLPAAGPTLRLCEYRIATNGQDQTVHIADIPSDGGPCITDPATATTGTITVAVEGLADMVGYRLLAGVFARSSDSSLVGGALWTRVDGDPFSDSDRVHPPAVPNPRTEFSDVDGWGADDYFWNETAQLPPGRYQVVLWANPGELAPYGSHIPSDQERACTVDIEVVAGSDTSVVVTGIPPGGEPCATRTFDS
jgi:hypothetical protein